MTGDLAKAARDRERLVTARRAEQVHQDRELALRQKALAEAQAKAERARVLHEQGAITAVALVEAESEAAQEEPGWLTKV